MSLRAHISHLSSCARSLYRYCTGEVRHDTSGKWWVRALMTVNLMVSKFLDKRLQDTACNLTYRTVLAAVPALAMLFAIGRGFGFQNLMQSELMRYFPAQRRALHEASQFVDSYLLHASQGLFVGIGIVFMLWTLISLMGNVESAFNRIWGVPRDRALARKVVDYTAFLVIIPVTLVCSAGIQIVLSSTLNNALSASSLISPLVHRLLDFTPIVLEWIAFVVAFKLIPNTQVSFKCALASGLVSGTVFYLVEWLFVSGQIYVSNYNAIYGSFAVVLLLLVWLQLSWPIVLAGCGLTYALQHNGDHRDSDGLDAMQQEYLDRIGQASERIIDSLRDKYHDNKNNS